MIGRRTFLKTVVASTAAATLAPRLLNAGKFQADSLQVWSCGGLSEAFNIANANYEKKTGIKVAYTGAFAAALGKSLLGGAVTEVFAGRVLKLAKDLRAANKMVYFRPLCFTEYVLITPLGNPAGIKSVEDLARPGVPIILPLGASPPGGDAVMGILKKPGVEEVALNLQACHSYRIESYKVGEHVHRKHGLPFLKMETDFSQGDVGQIRTRIEALLRYAGDKQAAFKNEVIDKLRCNEETEKRRNVS